MDADRRRLRASDQERDEVADQLRRHGTAGRLTVVEMSERIGKALEAKTLGELDDLLADLPEEPAAGLEVARRAPSLAAVVLSSRGFLVRVGQLALFNVVCIFIWLTSHSGSFWPGWVLLASGLLLTRRVVRAVEREEKRRRAELRAEKISRQLGP